MNQAEVLREEARILLHATGKTPPQTILERVQRQFQVDYASLMGIPGEIAVWAGSPTLNRLADVAAYALALDRLHYAPVAAGRVRRPEEWLQSSYGSWIERGVYKLGWGWQKPERLG